MEARLVCGVFCLALAVAHVVAAVRTPVSGPGERALFSVHEHLRVGAAELLGQQVIVPHEPSALGVVHEIVFDGRSGRLRYVVVRQLADDAAFSVGQLRPAGERLVLDRTQPASYGLESLEGVRWPSVRASSLLGRQVMDLERLDLGEIVDLHVNLASGRVGHAMLAMPGVREPSRVPIEALSELLGGPL